MSILKKILIINNIGLLIIIFLVACFLWAKKEKITPIIFPTATPSVSFSPEALFEQTGKSFLLNDPQIGNSGDVELSIDKNKTPLEISWPKEYTLLSLAVRNLGDIEAIDDNITLWGFSTIKPQKAALLPEEAGEFKIERTKIEPPIAYNFLQTYEVTWLPSILDNFRRDQRYSIEATFKKEREDKIYTGVYGFTY